MLTLGVGGPFPEFGDAGRRVRNVNAPSDNESGATLTEDLLEIFFVSDRPGGIGGSDIWYAERLARTDPFGVPAPLPGANSAVDDLSPAISADGLTLWLGSEREPGRGGMDIWRLTRPQRGAPWTAPENLDVLNSEFDDLPRPSGQGGEVLPFSSTRAGATYQTFLARRQAPGLDFTEIEPLADLWQSGLSMEEACLTNDGLLLFFRRSAPGEPGDLYVAWRSSSLEPFREPEALASVNTPADERDPFLSDDRSRFFFSSDRREVTPALDIYATTVELPTFE